MKMIRPIPFLALLGTLLVAGCGGIIELPNSGEPATIYNLTALDSPRGEGTRLMLMVEDPTTSGGLDVSKIARRSSPNELQYFAGVRWNTRSSRMFQDILAQSFENTGQYVTTSRGGAVVPSKFELQTEIRDFQAEFYNGTYAPTVHVRLSLNLVRMGPLEIVDTTIIDVRVPANGNDIYAIIAAFEGATHQAMQESIDWTLGLLQAEKTP